MKLRFLVLAFLSFAFSTSAQIVQRRPDCDRTFTLTAAGRSISFDNRQTACTTWHLTYYSTGFSAVSIQFDFANDSSGSPGSWSVWPDLASGTTLPLTATTSAQATGFKYRPWVSVNLNSVTGSGTVSGILIGYRAFAGDDASGTGGGSTVTANAGTGTFNMNLEKVGNTAVSGANVVDAVNTAFRMNCVVGCSGSSFADNAAFTFGTTVIANAGAVVDDTATNTVTENSAGAPRMNTNRILYFNPRNNAGSEIGIAALPLQVSLANHAANAVAVKVDGSAVTQPVGGTVSIDTQDDSVVFLAGVSDIFLSAAIVDDTATSTVAENSYGGVRMNTNRILYFNPRNNAGTEIGTSANPIFFNLAQVGGTNLTGANVVDGGNTAFRVNCIIGCAGSSFADNSAFTFGTTTISNIGAVVDDTATNVVAENSAGNPRMNTNRILYTMNTNSTGTEVGTAGSPFQVSLANTGANATAVKVDGSAVTQPISAASLPLPTGASTAAKQPALGTAGSASTDVITVQGIASMTKLLVTPDSVALPANQSVNMAQIAGTNTVTGGVAGLLAVAGNVANAVAATANPVPVGGIFTTVPATLTTGQTATLQFTAAQNAKHDITTIAGTAPTTAGFIDIKGADGNVFVRQATATNLNAAVVGTGTAGAPAGNILTVQGVTSMTKLLVTPDSVALPANQSVNVAQIAGTNTVTGGVAGIIAVGGNVANAVTATANPVPVGGIFSTTPATLTNGQTATFQFTAAQNLKQDLTTWGATVLGTPTNFGTTPGAVVAGSVNASLFLGTTAARSNQTTTGTGTMDVNIVGSLGATNSATNGTFMRLTDNTTAVGVIAGTTALKTDLSSVAGTAAGTAAAGVLKVGVVGNANAAFDAATAAAPPANRLAIGGLTSGATGGLMLSPTYCDQFANVNIVTAVTTLIVTGVSGRHVRICGISLVTAGANNVNFLSGTGATCGTGTTGMAGGTTAATGYNFAANGGIAQGSGIGIINQTNATGDSVCIITSAAVQLSGRISYAIW